MTEFEHTPTMCEVPVFIIQIFGSLFFPVSCSWSDLMQSHLKHLKSQMSCQYLNHFVCLVISTLVLSSTYCNHLSPSWSDFVSLSQNDYCALYTPHCHPMPETSKCVLHRSESYIIKYLKTFVTVCYLIF